MIVKEDWRLKGQEESLSGKTLHRRIWKAPHKEWDHKHCIFCWGRFSEFPDSLQEGYATEDNRPWICPPCFHDFNEMLHSTVKDNP